MKLLEKVLRLYDVLSALRGKEICANKVKDRCQKIGGKATVYRYLSEISESTILVEEKESSKFNKPKTFSLTEEGQVVIKNLAEVLLLTGYKSYVREEDRKGYSKGRYERNAEEIIKEALDE